MRPAHLLAVGVSAVLGAALGVTGGFLSHQSDDFADPLGLGVPLVNQTCGPGSLLVVATGNSSTALSSAVASDESHSVRYLATARSCATAWGRNGPRPLYAAYVGPLATDVACARRMTVEHRGDLVTTLDASSTEPVPCLCYVNVASMPVLRSGVTGTLESIYIRALQEMLTKLNRNPPDHLTQVYDAQTIAAVKKFQHDHAVTPANGVVDSNTWHTIVGKGCSRY